MARVRRAAEEAGTPAAKKDSEGGQAGAESSLAQPGRCGQDEVSAVGIPAMMRATGSCWMPRANNARGKVRGALPRSPARGFHPLRPLARGTPPETPAPFPSGSTFRNGPRRQGFAPPRKTRAPLTAPGRSEQLTYRRERGPMQSRPRLFTKRGHFYRGHSGDISIEV